MVIQNSEGFTKFKGFHYIKMDKKTAYLRVVFRQHPRLKARIFCRTTKGCLHFFSKCENGFPNFGKRQRLAVSNGELRRGAHLPYAILELVGG